MIFFIICLRALAACLITNAHYVGIYPTDMIANGGLIGDVLFFAVSGYCLYYIKYDLSPEGFGLWYGKRLWRVYPPVVIMTVIYIALGAYQISKDHGFIWWFIYPTYYHFVASILVLYIPFFIIMKINALRNRIPFLMALLAVAWITLYFTAYDRSYYHIDNVHEPMIRFLFMESMLLGAWFRQNDTACRNQAHAIYPIAAIVAFVIYFASKLAFARSAKFVVFQFLNQIAIFALLFFIFRSFAGWDERLEKMGGWIKRIITFVSNLTLEIYVVQYVLIPTVRNLNFPFPLNWMILSLSIITTAYLLHLICACLYKCVDKLKRRKAK